MTRFRDEGPGESLLPSGVRIGMFCRLGTMLLKRPVARHCLIERRVHASRARIHELRQGIDVTVPFSFISCRHSRICRGISWESAVLRALQLRLRGREVPVCLSTGNAAVQRGSQPAASGELMLNSPPAMP